jgi:hypothetical protein
MNRRNFLGLLGVAAVGARVGMLLPAAEPLAYLPEAAVNVIPNPSMGYLPMRGLPYIIENSGMWFGRYYNQGYEMKSIDFGQSLDMPFIHLDTDRRRIGRAIRKARRTASIPQL